MPKDFNVAVLQPLAEWPFFKHTWAQYYRVPTQHTHARKKNPALFPVRLCSRLLCFCSERSRRSHCASLCQSSTCFSVQRVCVIFVLLCFFFFLLLNTYFVCNGAHFEIELWEYTEYISTFYKLFPVSEPSCTVFWAVQNESSFKFTMKLSTLSPILGWIYCQSCLVQMKMPLSNNL